MTHTYTRTHVSIGFANPFMVCERCGERARGWHNPERCGCDAGYWVAPCMHDSPIRSSCSTWSPVDGCMCQGEDTHEQ